MTPSGAHFVTDSLKQRQSFKTILWIGLLLPQVCWAASSCPEAFSIPLKQQLSFDFSDPSLPTSSEFRDALGFQEKQSLFRQVEQAQEQFELWRQGHEYPKFLAELTENSSLDPEDLGQLAPMNFYEAAAHYLAATGTQFSRQNSSRRNRRIVPIKNGPFFNHLASLLDSHLKGVRLSFGHPDLIDPQSRGSYSVGNRTLFLTPMTVIDLHLLDNPLLQPQLGQLILEALLQNQILTPGYLAKVDHRSGFTAWNQVKFISFAEPESLVFAALASVYAAAHIDPLQATLRPDDPGRRAWLERAQAQLSKALMLTQGFQQAKATLENQFLTNDPRSLHDFPLPPGRRLMAYSNNYEYQLTSRRLDTPALSEVRSHLKADLNRLMSPAWISKRNQQLSRLIHLSSQNSPEIETQLMIFLKTSLKEIPTPESGLHPLRSLQMAVDSERHHP